MRADTVNLTTRRNNKFNYCNKVVESKYSITCCHYKSNVYLQITCTEVYDTSRLALTTLPSTECIWRYVDTPTAANNAHYALTFH